MKVVKRGEFDLFGTKYTIKEVDKLTDDKGEAIYGHNNGSSKVIEIARTINGFKVAEEDVRLTLYHELFHAIFGEGCYGDSNVDEPLVEWCAKCLRTLIDQKVI